MCFALRECFFAISASLFSQTWSSFFCSLAALRRLASRSLGSCSWSLCRENAAGHSRYSRQVLAISRIGIMCSMSLRPGLEDLGQEPGYLQLAQPIKPSTLHPGGRAEDRRCSCKCPLTSLIWQLEIAVAHRLMSRNLLSSPQELSGGTLCHSQSSMFQIEN